METCQRSLVQMQRPLDFIQFGRAVTLGRLATGATGIAALESSSLRLSSHGMAALDLDVNTSMAEQLGCKYPGCVFHIK